MATAGDAPPALAADRYVRTSPAVYAPPGPSTEHGRAGWCVHTAGLIRNASRLRSLSREGPPWRSGTYDECVTIAGNRMASLSDYH